MMRYLLPLLLLCLLACAGQAQTLIKSNGLLVWDSTPETPAALPHGAEVIFVRSEQALYCWNIGESAWEPCSSGIDTLWYNADTLHVVTSSGDTLSAIIPLGDYATLTALADTAAALRDDLTALLADTAATLRTYVQAYAVPLTRTLTINGTAYDLSANRTWNVGDLLSTGSYANPTWITSLAWTKITGTPTTLAGYGIADGVTGTGVAGRAAFWSSTNTLSNSENFVWDNVTKRLAISNTGAFSSPSALLHLRGVQTDIRLTNIGGGASDHTEVILESAYGGAAYIQHWGPNTAFTANRHGLQLRTTHASGSIQFKSGNATETSAPTMYLSPGGSLGVGTNNPASKLHLYHLDQSPLAAWIEAHNATTAGAQLRLSHSRNVVGLHNKILSGYELGRLSFEGYDSTAYLVGASILAVVEANASPGYMPSYLAFSTTTTSTAIERMRITSAGLIGLGTSTPQRRLHVAGEVRITDLVTDTPTVLVGADADGDLGQVTIGSNLSLLSGVLSANLSAYATWLALADTSADLRTYIDDEIAALPGQDGNGFLDNPSGDLGDAYTATWADEDGNIVRTYWNAPNDPDFEYTNFFGQWSEDTFGTNVGYAGYVSNTNDEGFPLWIAYLSDDAGKNAIVEFSPERVRLNHTQSSADATVTMGAGIVELFGENGVQIHDMDGSGAIELLSTVPADTTIWATAPDGSFHPIEPAELRYQPAFGQMFTSGAIRTYTLTTANTWYPIDTLSTSGGVVAPNGFLFGGGTAADLSYSDADTRGFRVEFKVLLEYTGADATFQISVHKNGSPVTGFNEQVVGATAGTQKYFANSRQVQAATGDVFTLEIRSTDTSSAAATVLEATMQIENL